MTHNHDKQHPGDAYQKEYCCDRYYYDMYAIDVLFVDFWKEFHPIELSLSANHFIKRHSEVYQKEVLL